MKETLKIDQIFEHHIFFRILQASYVLNILVSQKEEERRKES